MVLGQTTKGHEFLKHVCLNYPRIKDLVAMLITDIETISPRAVSQRMLGVFEHHLFVEYLVDFLFLHAAEAERHGTLQDSFRTMFNSNIQGYFERWIYIHDLVREYRKDRVTSPSGEETDSISGIQGSKARPLHIFSQYGLLAKDIAEEADNINARGGLYYSALMAAAAGGHEVAAGFLLQAGADPRISTNIKIPMFLKGVNRFHWAAAREDVSTFNQLLEGSLSLFNTRRKN